MNKLITEQKLKEFGKDYVKNLWRELRREGKDASGALLNSLDYRIVEDAKQIKLEILANDYLKHVDEDGIYVEYETYLEELLVENQLK
jgi:hypothetical protein